MLNLCCAIDKMDKTFSSTTRFEIKLPVPQGFVVARPRLLAKSERVKGSDCFWALFNSLPSHVKLCTWWRASKMSDLRLTFGGYKTQKVWRALTAMRGVDQIIINFPRAIIRFRADIRLRVSKGCNIKAVLGTKRLGQSLNEKPGPQLQGKPEWISEWAPMNAGPSPWTALGSCVGQHVFCAFGTQPKGFEGFLPKPCSCAALRQTWPWACHWRGAGDLCVDWNPAGARNHSVPIHIIS